MMAVEHLQEIYGVVLYEPYLYHKEGALRMPHPADVHAGRRLKMLRKSRKLTQTDVAKKMGIAFQQIQKYESGANRIAFSRLWELAQIFGVDLNYFSKGLKTPKKKKTDVAHTSELEHVQV